VVQCPECGNFDSLGLGFCTVCGKVLPKPAISAGRYKEATCSEPEKVGPPNDEEVRSRVYAGLATVSMIASFLFIYLVISGADPLDILVIEAFPICWLLLILLQLGLLKKKSGNS
jgi:hypothetical protein